MLLIRNSQRETVAASSLSRNPFAALDDDQVDIVSRHGLVRVSQAHTIPAAEFDLMHADSDLEDAKRSVRADVMRPRPEDGHDVPRGRRHPNAHFGRATSSSSTWHSVLSPRAPQLRAAFETMDQVNGVGIFRYRAAVMKTVPRFLQGPFRNVMKVVLEEVMASEEVGRLS